MPETISVRIDPDTGQEYEVRTETPPAVPYVPPDRSGMNGINRAAFNAAVAGQKVDDALKAAQAAVQFQGLRGYQQALKSGESPEKAMVKFGPLMFNKQATAFGPAQRAVTPPTVPQITPYQREVLDLRRKAASGPGASSLPTEFQRDPNKEYITKGGALIPKIGPVTTETVRQIPNKEFSPGMTNVPPYLSLTNRTTRNMPQSPAAASKIPFKEGQRIKDKSGKFYIVKGGVPVPE